MSGLLTPRQREILKHRMTGKTQREIAEILGTSRENITIAEKRAREKVKRALETIREYEKITATPIDISEITDPTKIPKIIFTHADKVGLKVAHSATDIIELVEAYAKTHGKTPKKALLLESGKIELEST
ncbi:MAG: Tfx family DNA-binding protein [Candidatus Hydrothermarchaeales archaeon]